jgi:hypothetical protein
MKNTLVIGFLVILAAAILSAFAFAIWPAMAMNNKQITTQPEQVVQDFYSWYLAYPGNPLVEHAYRSSSYLSPEMTAFLDAFTQGGMAYDPVVCAQDKPTEIRTAQAQVSVDKAIVDVTTSFEDHSFSVELTQTSRGWQINKVTCPVH